MDAASGKTATTLQEPIQPPLRIGLLVDRAKGFQNWQLALIDRILMEDRLHLEALIVCPPKTENASALFRLAGFIERSALGRQPQYKPRSQGLVNVPVTTKAELAQGTAGENLDLVLSISPVHVQPDDFCHLPYGRWSFSFLNDASTYADWFGYQEVLQGKSSTELRLTVRRSDSDEDKTLAIAEFNTKFSAIRNGDFVKERAVTLVMRELCAVADARALTTVPSPARKAAQPPNASACLSYLTSVVSNLLKRSKMSVMQKLGYQAPSWALFVGDGQPQDFDPRTAVLLRPEDGDLRADPFLFQHEGQTYVFYEAYTPQDTKAHIAVGRLVGNSLERIGVALSADHHLSYPYVFRKGDDIFLVPETNEARHLEVWRCRDFPMQWELHATGLEGICSADSALFPFADKWWLFTNLSDFHAYQDHCSELHIFEVDGPDLKWMKPHRNNPVVMGSTTARNGGRPFVHAGSLYRPSQRNENGIYGYGLNLMKVEHLDLTTYREKCVRTIDPDFAPGLLACHHMDAAGGRYVIDAMFANQASLLR